MKDINIYYDINEHISENMTLGINENSSVRRFINFIKKKEEKYTYCKKTGRYFINTFFPSFPSEAWNTFQAGLQRIIRGDKVPFQADIVVTGKCHCDCWHCFRGKYSNQEELSLERIVEIFRSLKNLGTSIVGITGGEPMLRKDILDIVSLIPDSMEGQLYTTGIYIDEEFAQRILKTNLKRCIISLDHYKEEIVCKLRKNKHAFYDAVHAIQVLKESYIYVATTVCINDEMLLEGELERYIQFVKNLGVNEIRMVSTIPQGNLEGSNEAQKHIQATKLIRELKHKYAQDPTYPAIVNFSEIESFKYLGCGAGVNYLSINADGNVTPCVSVPLTFGNVCENSLESIYQSMNRYFPEAACSCIGVATDSIRKKIGIEIKKPPLDLENSIRIIEECKCSMRSAKFFEALREEL